MRTAAALQVRVMRFGLWRAIVLLLAAGAVASMVAWWWSQPPPAAPSVAAAAACCALAAFAVGLASWRTPSLTLRWDGQRWLVAHDGSAERAGEMAVAIDLGGWMLLRFTAEAVPAGPRRRVVWTALQRSGLESQWHVLRCALYSTAPARPAGGGAGEAANESGTA